MPTAPRFTSRRGPRSRRKLVSGQRPSETLCSAASAGAPPDSRSTRASRPPRTTSARQPGEAMPSWRAPNAPETQSHPEARPVSQFLVPRSVAIVKVASKRGCHSRACAPLRLQASRDTAAVAAICKPRRRPCPIAVPEALTVQHKGVKGHNLPGEACSKLASRLGSGGLATIRRCRSSALLGRPTQRPP